MKIAHVKIKQSAKFHAHTNKWFRSTQ